MAGVLRQNIIISRLNARGAVQARADSDDYNKVVKTDASGYIDPTLLPASEAWDDAAILFSPHQMAIIEDAGTELIIVQDEFDATYGPVRKFTAIDSGQTLKLAFAIRITADNILFNSAHAYSIIAKVSDADPNNKLTIDINSGESDVVTPTVTYDEYEISRDEPAHVFDDGDYAIFEIVVSCNQDESIYIGHMVPFFEVGP